MAVVGITQQEEPVKVWMRPNVHKFLKHLNMFAEIVLFTASVEQYADPVADLLDPDRSIFRHRLYRDHTRWVVCVHHSAQAT